MEEFVTCFPLNPEELPQDFQTYAEAKQYGDEKYGEGGYTIESPFRGGFNEGRA